jgi:hypothetical protein
MVQELLDMGHIVPSNMLTRKKDKSFHMCMDYRELKNMNLKNRVPIPCINELLTKFNVTKIFMKINFRFGYHKIRLRQCDQFKTTFRTHHGHDEFHSSDVSWDI